METNWNSGRIKVEPSLHKRTCHKCGIKIPKGTFSVKVKISGDRHATSNNLCQGCLVEATAIVKFMNNEGEDYRRVYV
jgi:NMD protein affecting ribosome stability and mRNA decay